MTVDSFLVKIMAVSISLTLHALFFFFFLTTVLTKPLEKTAREKTITQIHLVKIAKVANIKTSELLNTKVAPAPLTPKPVLPTVHRKHIKIKTAPLKPHPVIKPDRILRPKHIQRIETIKKKPASVSQLTFAKAAVASAPVKQAPVDKDLIARKRLKYLAKVMAHIERYKYYPTTARRRGIEGDVHISFLLLTDGTTQQLMVKGASSILRKAAKKAIAKATPMPKPPTGIHFPMHCEFAIRYAFK